jgi:hypothetical protein
MKLFGIQGHLVAKSLAIAIGGVPFAAVAATGSTYMEPSEVRAQLLGERSPVVRLQRDQEPLELPSFRAILGDREVDKMNEARSRLSILGDDVDQGAELQKLNIKPSVDLRGRDTPVKQQVGPLCTAWALTGVMENALGGVDTKTGKPLDLSEKHLWSYYGVYSAAEAIYNATQSKITEEEYWPSNNKNPFKGYLGAARTELLSYRFMGESVKKSLEALDRGNPVYVGMRVPADMSDRVAVVGPNSTATSGGHALAIVGYQLDASIKGGGYFIMKNSWGAKIGDHGYQYVSFYNCMRSDMYCYFWEVDDVVRENR